MSGRILPFFPSAHAAADARLPWYVNGTLRGKELAFVEQHLQACEQCRREVDWLRELFVACAGVPLADWAGAGPESHPGRESPSAPEFATARAAGAGRAAPPWIYGLIAAQLAAIVVLGTLLVLDGRNDASYRTLGTSNSTARTQDAIAVMFDPAVSEADLRRIVLRAGARIADGPTATNAFVLRVPAGQSSVAIAALRAEPGVRFAESLGARTEQ